MPQIFHPSTNTISKVSLALCFLLIIGAIFLLGAVERSPYMTQVHVIRDQPVPFSHAHHVAGLGIDCRYCHNSVEESSFAGMPAIGTCMNCHSQIWTDSEMLAPIREAYQKNTPIAWTRVHDLPDFTYFDHSIHVKRGIDCQHCHGNVGQMPLLWKESALQMEWCLGCHRNPQRFLKQHATEQKIHNLTNCSVCHR